jgi:hypothetical protein
MPQQRTVRYRETNIQALVLRLDGPKEFWQKAQYPDAYEFSSGRIFKDAGPGRGIYDGDYPE